MVNVNSCYKFEFNNVRCLFRIRFQIQGVIPRIMNLYKEERPHKIALDAVHNKYLLCICKDSVETASVTVPIMASSGY